MVGSEVLHTCRTKVPAPSQLPYPGDGSSTDLNSPVSQAGFRQFFLQIEILLLTCILSIQCDGTSGCSCLCEIVNEDERGWILRRERNADGYPDADNVWHPCLHEFKGSVQFPAVKSEAETLTLQGAPPILLGRGLPP